MNKCECKNPVITPLYSYCVSHIIFDRYKCQNCNGYVDVPRNYRMIGKKDVD